MNIAVPDNKLFRIIYENIEDVCLSAGFNLLKLPESQINKFMLLNKFDIAFLTPLGYGLGVKSSDYRILPGKCMSLEGYTGSASLYFAPGAKSINKLAVENHEDFFVQICKIILAERYETFPEINTVKGDLRDILKTNDLFLSYQNDTDFKSLDLSEDWFDTFEIPLPIGFWVCRNEEAPDDVLNLINSFAKDSLEDEIIIETSSVIKNELINREGKILTRWNNDIKDSLEQLIQLLYFHQCLPELPAIKIYGFDEPVLK
jgi:predicted solute-binding protein